MSIDILSRDILQKAQGEKESIETEFEAQITIAQEISKKNIISFKEKLDRKYEEETSIQKEKILGNYKRESKKEILKVKTLLIEQIYDEVYTDLCNLRSEDKEKFFSEIIKSVKQNGFNFK